MRILVHIFLTTQKQIRIMITRHSKFHEHNNRLNSQNGERVKKYDKNMRKIE